MEKSSLYCFKVRRTITAADRWTVLYSHILEEFVRLGTPVSEVTVSVSSYRFMTASWCSLRAKHGVYSGPNVEICDNNVIRREASFTDQFLWGDKVYTYGILKKSKSLKSYEWNDYRKIECLEDDYGNLWYYQYDENDHLYHIQEDFINVDNVEMADRMYVETTGQASPVSFHTIQGSGCCSFIMYEQLDMKTLDEVFRKQELRRLQRMNGVIPPLIE